MARRNTLGFPLVVLALMVPGHAMGQYKWYPQKLYGSSDLADSRKPPESLPKEAYGNIRSIKMPEEGKNVICKFSPYRTCYHLDESGKLHRIDGHQPLSTVRVYDKGNPPRIPGPKSMGFRLPAQKRSFRARLAKAKQAMTRPSENGKAKKSHWSAPSYICWRPPC